jgi:hypothetical protein
MKSLAIRIFLCLLLFSSLAVTAMAYSIEGGLDAHNFSLIDRVLANKIPGCGNCLELKDINDTPSELLAGRIPACGNCLELQPTLDTPDELLARAAGCGSCGDDEPEG